ncbi:hypothetical protein K6U06_14030 [Acidiferrimicrobium sp. IK]|uniref:hypothetical protein n=1 Tax=Acidiferrimicrobium sp. IK TaxID=2871700 RepID=UPI0021CB2F87|nr:hypothetical protein [Acidiferrimicrobium sp. IK]MCU4185488.1 hypothetical protein [Acidiferrimicrobium sp. IK]
MPLRPRRRRPATRDAIEEADVGAELTRAIGETQARYQTLRLRAAELMAHQKQADAARHRARRAAARLEEAIRAALAAAERAERQGDTESAAAHRADAARDARRLAVTRRDLDQLDALARRWSGDATATMEAVEGHLAVLRRRLSEHQQLLAELRQAEARERLNQAVAGSRWAPRPAPDLDALRDEVRRRWAEASGGGPGVAG